MKYTASIDIMPIKELLDPQGKTIEKNLKNIDITELSNIRVGKHIDLKVDAASEEQAKQKVENACKKMFANLIMESYHFDIKEAE